MRTSEQECLDALEEAAERLGKSPTKAGYEELGLRPASATIIRVVGGWNKAKERASLETYTSGGSRVEPKSESIDLPDNLDWEELSVDQRWHYRNRSWNTERSLQRRSRLRSWANDQKSARCCQNCGEDDAAVLDFHHREPGDKKMPVGKMITYGYGKEKLLNEIQKCEVLCSNCHRKNHYDRSRASQLRQSVQEIKRSSDGCSRSVESDPRTLVFHHAGNEKRATVAEMISDGKSKQKIVAEIQRCVILCSNCHRKEHFEPPQAGD